LSETCTLLLAAITSLSPTNCGTASRLIVPLETFNPQYQSGGAAALKMLALIQTLPATTLYSLVISGGDSCAKRIGKWAVNSIEGAVCPCVNKATSFTILNRSIICLYRLPF
jgi:hypothetical protein